MRVAEDTAETSHQFLLLMHAHTFNSLQNCTVECLRMGANINSISVPLLAYTSCQGEVLNLIRQEGRHDHLCELHTRIHRDTRSSSLRNS